MVDDPGDGDRREERGKLVQRLVDRRGIDPATADAMRAVPRHEFVPPGSRDAAYDDTPLPIGEGQTISAPHMVAIMTDLLEFSGDERVLEIGTGCGYHAAVTAECVGASNVYSVEYHESLARDARETLRRTGYGDVSVRVGDGREGWPEHAPYDRTYLTCAAREIPDPLIDQLATDGILLAPVGRNRQTLVRVRKRADGSLERSDHGGVRFVPLQ